MDGEEARGGRRSRRNPSRRLPTSSNSNSKRYACGCGALNPTLRCRWLPDRSQRRPRRDKIHTDKLCVLMTLSFWTLSFWSTTSLELVSCCCIFQCQLQVFVLRGGKLASQIAPNFAIHSTCCTVLYPFCRFGNNLHDTTDCSLQ